MERARAHGASTRDGRSSGDRIGSLLSGIARDAEELVREHADLARAEVKESIAKARNVSIIMVAAGVLGGLGTIFLLATLALGINVWLDSRWIGFGVVTLICLIAAAVAFAVGKKRLKEVQKPLPQTTDAIKEDVAWVSTTLKSLK